MLSCHFIHPLIAHKILDCDQIKVHNLSNFNEKGVSLPHPANHPPFSCTSDMPLYFILDSENQCILKELKYATH